MILKYNFEIDNKIIINRIINLINQIYKLLPIREEGSNWQVSLETILEQLVGIQRLLIIDSDAEKIFFPLISKLEGLYELIDEKDFSCYRRTIFECLNLMNKLRQLICHQELQKLD